MRPFLSSHPAGRPAAVAAVALALVFTLGHAVGSPADREATPVTAPVTAYAPQEAAEEVTVQTVAAPPPTARSSWSGFAFDACRAPSQQVMDRWKVSSPFTGVGIYLGGIHRACEQEHLSSTWVTRQLSSGWNLLPIWVGPQASCTGYDHRIPGKPAGNYRAARARGVDEARGAARKAEALAIPKGEVIFYDIEPFDTGQADCRRSSLALLETWTAELHELGYRSGVYSHAKAGISLLSKTGPDYLRPDAVWYAWIDRVGSIPGEYVADQAFMRTSRVHQYALDERVEFGGVSMDIDWDYVSLGSTSPPTHPASCEQLAARSTVKELRPGVSGPAVRLAQCLVLPGDWHPTKTSGRYDAATARAVRSFQHRRGLQPTGALDRRTWISLLARGHTPVLKKGARGEPVQRLQRTLNAALPPRRRIHVDGDYGAATARAVKAYRRHLGLQVKPVVTARVWAALERGRPVQR
ncbi:MAG TPA: glycoside hydrolase domain-containing protein [Nocardioidaceae bacterium]|nr:glycoside hydrolase domain-containing protein [Nocardioidaceae bacterium]